MQYNVQGFNQIEVIKMGLSNDDLTILNWFLRYKDTGKMDCINIEEAKQYGFWVSYNKLIEDLPLLFNGPDFLESQLKLKPLEFKMRDLEKQGLKYEDQYKELEKEYKELKNKLYRKHKEKIRRIFSGSLSQILLRKEKKLNEKQGTKIYLYLNYENFNKIHNSATTLETYLKENGVDIENTNNSTPYKNDQCKNDIEDSTPHKNVECITPHKNVECITPHKNVECNITTNDTNTIDINTTATSKNEVVVNTNKELIEEHTHLEIHSTYKKNKVKKWNKDRLNKSIEIFNNQDGKYFSLLEKIYNDDNNFIAKKKNNTKTTSNKKTRFHNINQTFDKYDPNELEKMLHESQKGKFTDYKK